MKKVWNFVGSWVARVVLSLYITFVLQMLWNWFATQAFHIENIGYWNMFGLLLIPTLVKTKNSDTGETHLLTRVMTMVEASLPEDKREETMRQLEEGEIAKLFRPTSVDAMKALGGTFFFVVGFVVHTLSIL
jgi:hypothetical protein